MKRPVAAAVALLCLAARSARAEEDAMNMEMPMHMAEEPLGVSDHRAASGTSWQPDTTPMHAWHFMSGDWMLMLHGVGFFGYDRQWSARGGDALPSVNWIMAMANHPVGERGVLTLRGMFSAEAWTVPPRGYPLLLQTGETFHGEPLHDVQHPHDFFMELSASIRAPVGDSIALEGYGAAAGEPALGPTAFPHRASAASAPLAPIGHHWEDSTHVSFGVITMGAYTRFAKLEGSWFNGHEPDQDRRNFDFAPLDSFSTRLTVNPLPQLSAEVSYGFLASPEAHDPGSEHRVVASATWDSSFAFGDIAATASWARKLRSGGEPATDAALLEADLTLFQRIDLFGRVERVEKPGHDLALPTPDDERVFVLDAATVGGVVDLGHVEGLVPGLGAQLTLDRIPADLEPYYGTRTPAGYMVFARLRFD